MLVWRRCVQSVTSRVEGAQVHWECDLSPFPLLDLVRLLLLSPLGLIEYR
ncbi:MAG TPA: hypothetical protein VFZ65_02125 [Planctomycetota bacterium]|nr:hypothetical protein [Planctomycetota bacterium]